VKSVLVISGRDNVATALEPLEPERRLEIGGVTVVVRDQIPSGHKVALTAIAVGDAVIKYGSPIGLASAPILAGMHVHTHNLSSSRGRGDLEAAPQGAQPRLAEPPDERLGIAANGNAPAAATGRWSNEQ
jgi:altronate hydrolase